MPVASPLTILRVIPRYAPAWSFGGGVRVSYDLDRALLQRGFAVTVCTSDQIDERRHASTLHDNLEGIQIHRFPNPSTYLASRVPWMAYYPVGLRPALIEQARHCDLMHVAEARGPHVSWAFAAARAAGVPVVWSPLGGLADGVGMRQPYRRAYDILHRTRRCIGEARVLVAQSPHEAALLARLGAPAAQVRVIGLGVDARRFQELPPRGGFRRTAGIDPDRPLVLFMGRFHPTKGLDVLLKAVALARRTHPDLVAALVGWDHGSLRTVTRLTRSLGLKQVVTIAPPAFGPAAVQAYVDADVFAVAATLYEETSLAAMEALASGTPCVLTRQCEVPGLQALGAGVVTECEPEPFAAGLVSLLSNPRRRLLGLAARQWMLASHTSEHSADAYAATFRESVGADASCAAARAGRTAC